VVEKIVMIYLLAWLFTSVVLAVSSRLLKDRWSPARHPLAISLVAGGVWLLLLVGAAQFGALVAVKKALAEDEREVARISAGVDEFA
jgi:hypothetical protein